MMTQPIPMPPDAEHTPEEINQELWGIVVTLAIRLGGISISAEELRAAVGVSARMHLDVDGSASITVPPEEMPDGPVITHTPPATVH